MLEIAQQMTERRSFVKDTRNYSCAYCHRAFAHEHTMLKHKCETMKRTELLKSPTGQAAWNYYSIWMRAQHRIPANAAVFMASKSFTTFIKFVEFAKKVSLPKPDRFIAYMIKKKFTPNMWTTDPVYAMYLEYIDRTLTPIQQATTSIETIFKVSDNFNVDPSDVFTVIKGHDLIHMLQTRRLSPWLLLNSKKFKTLYKALPTEQRMIVDGLIRIDYWATKLQEHASEVAQIRLLTAELGI